MSLIEKIDAMKVKAQRLIVEPPHDSLDEIANDISEGYITACNEIRDYILSEKKEPCGFCKNSESIIYHGVTEKLIDGTTITINGDTKAIRCPMCGRPINQPSTDAT